MYISQELRSLRRSALAAALLFGGSAMAEEQDGQEQDAEEAATLDSVQVTARKRTESLIEVPLNISAISAQELADRNLNEVEDLYRTLAGAASPTGELILRGLSGSNSVSPGTTNQFVDGIPFNFGNVFDVEQVEVLRGPQGTLWGSNAIGGTVQIITRKPQLDAFEAFGSLRGTREKNGTGTVVRGEGGINIPLLRDTLALRVAASTSDVPGKVVNVYTGKARQDEETFVRTQLQWEPTPDLHINLGHIYTRTKSWGTLNSDASVAGYYWQPTLTENADSPWGYDVQFDQVACPEGASRPVCLGGGNGGTDSRFAIYELLDPWSKATTNLFSLNVEHDDLFGIASVSYVGSFRKNASRSLDNWSRLDMDDMSLTWILNDSTTRRVTHELRFQNLERRGGVDWTVGLFEDRSWQGYNPNTQWQYNLTDPQSIAIFSAWNDWAWDDAWAARGVHNVAELGQVLYGNPGANYNYQTLRSLDHEQAAFGEASYRLETGIGDFELTGGIRYYRLEDLDSYARSGIWIGAEDNQESYGGKESGNRKKLSLAYLPNRDLNVYALYSEGYRPGGNNGPLANACADDSYAGQYRSRYTSDKIENYEVGFKGLLFDRRLRLASAVYHIDWNDVRASVYMPSCGFSYTANAAKARSRGVELESALLLDSGTAITFNASYTDAVILSDVSALGASKGDTLPQVPRYNAYLAVDQELRLLGRQAFVRADVAAYGSYKTHFNTRPEDVSPAYHTFNLSGRLRLSDSTQVSLHLDNLFNEEYYTYRAARSRTSSRQALYQRYGAERSVTLRLDYSFR
ncbi:MAG: TonB-dependent receptor [Pseudomonas sp.]